jgi:hypothetical protein
MDRTPSLLRSPPEKRYRTRPSGGGNTLSVMELKPGTRLRSQTCAAEVIVVKAPAGAVDLCCGGAPLIPIDAAAGQLPIDDAHRGGTLLGKRYADEAAGLEILCTKAGEGSLSVGATPLPMKEAKPLPSSD